MAAKFTAGDSAKTTVTTARKNPPPNVRTRSHSLRSGNTMSGMPGYIDAHQREDMGGAKGGKGFGPHREGPVGEKGGSGVKRMAKAGKAPGTVVKNYHASATDSPSSIKSNANTGAHPVHTANRQKSMPGQKAPPTSRGILGGTVKRAGLDAFKGGGLRAVVPKGHGGRMEKLAGRARTSFEGRRKSNMY
jgi:hypothetical protein